MYVDNLEGRHSVTDRTPEFIKLESDIKNIIFESLKDIQIHKVDDINMILEIDYEGIAAKIMLAVKENI